MASEPAAVLKYLRLRIQLDIPRLGDPCNTPSQKKRRQMQAVDCPALVRAVSRTPKFDVNEHADRPSTFTFVVLADPQLGLLERYVEKRPLPHHWDRELAWVDQAVRLVNLLDPRPKFVIVCGDLVDAQPGSDYRKSQTLDLLHAFSQLDSSIALLTLPGNHDVGDSPTPEGLRDYTHTWGDDYYSFQINHSDFLVFNSQFWWDDSNCKGASREFNSWVENQLVRLKQKSSSLPVVFQHIPFFTNSFDEPDDYFNIPQTMRSSVMCKLYDAGVRHVFTGHLHKNSIHTWVPPGKPDASDPLHLISSSAVCVQLGCDQPGIRLVEVSTGNFIQHDYWSLDQLEMLLVSGKQPNVPH
ncbi:serine/threonine-protein phosphatase CPPED1 [Paragonimus westermani]|uniref:Serine/threonine-protein phosphatase CPPED1 n=1 Tax=Paragonimus westermani TaxID=34504 RepID=A0A5J4NLD9_9TREM|nr:serine/threonine-protein phosphatase CPPED1 [Paragonimus westermani]